MAVKIELKNLARVQRAMKKSPEIMRDESRDFLVRAMAAVRRIIWNEPWRMASGEALIAGGVPVAAINGGNLRQSHRTDFFDFKATIGPDIAVAPYAEFVHEGTMKMEARPWLNFAEEQAAPEVNALARDILKRVVAGIANAT